MIEIKNLSVKPRLQPLSFSVESGEILHIIGPNGSGKSTLLEAISGLLSCEGDVLYSGQLMNRLSLTELAKQRAYLSQTSRPAFAMTVFHYLSLSIVSPADQKDIAEAILEITQLLSIEDKLERSIHQLSGGEWQRVRLAGVCIQIWPLITSKYEQQQKVLLLDEPGAPLDVGQESLLYRLIDLIASKGIAVVMANHDLNRTLRYSDKVLVLKEGVVQAFGPTQQVITESLLSATYNTNVKMVMDDTTPYLIFD